MRGPKPEQIRLSSIEREVLERIISKSTSEQRLVKRARIILLCEAGQNNQQVAKQMGVNRDMVRTWRGRWLLGVARIGAVAATGDEKALREVIESVLTDAPRPGCPPSFSEKQIVDILAIACEDPQACGRPISHWTPREVAEEAQARNIVASISTRSVGRFLKRGGLKTA